MAEAGQGHSRIVKDRKWEDYRSLKQYYRNHNLEEIIIICYDTSTATAAELQPDPTTTITYLGAEGVVYVRNQTDVEAQDGATVYITYLNEAGTIKVANTELAIAGHAGGTAAPMILGFEGFPDTINGEPVAGAVTCTSLNATANQYDGMYLIIYSGNNVGEYGLILSHTVEAAGGVVFTTDNVAWTANSDADLVSIQSTVYDDFFRLREMSFGVEGGDADNTWICNLAGNAWYGIISDLNTQAVVPRYFVPVATTGQNTKYYLGYIKASAQRDFEADNDALGHKLTVTYTPKALNANIPAADVTIEITFMDKIVWQPCIELEPATDVIVKISKILDANHDTVFVESCFLEVDRLTN